MKQFQLIRFFSLAIIFLLCNSLSFADKPAYEIYEKDGSSSDFEDMAEAAAEADIILFGELHNNPIGHWLELELTIAVYEENDSNLVIGGEMWESDDQIKIDEYMNGHISKKSFEKESRLWKNYKTDYRPILEFAKKNKLRFFASNTPRRYASSVAKRDLVYLDSLSSHSKRFFAPLPIEVDLALPGYAKIKEEMTDTTHGVLYVAEAQAMKDATMSHFILANFKPGTPLIHFNGAYHSNDFEAIYWYLKKSNPELKIITISNTEQDDISELEEDNEGMADFIIVTPKNMTKTY